MIEGNRLAEASSPYLRQHRDNPVWWQEWSAAIVDEARALGRPLFVSVGYATCHWCHVMAAEAFSDPGVAAALNRDFICVKVDREERPDIDDFLMQFLLATRGHGGWPLNVFLTPDLRPMLALTYMPVHARGGMPGFVDILARVRDFHDENADRLPVFDLWEARGAASGQPGSAGKSAGTDGAATPNAGSDVPVPGDPQPFRHRLQNLLRRADRDMGGFGTDAKFPPHSTLLFQLFGIARYQDADTAAFVRGTLDVMARRGLHDHLQGGFFRYCVDRAWTVPHFEKMLYDQAMLLWVYARAAKVLDEARYAEVALGIVRALEETFTLSDACFRSALDADTDHEEGGSYLWDTAELEDFDLSAVSRVFLLHDGGTVDGRHHLMRIDDKPLAPDARELLERMLVVRKTRQQPGTDDKVVTAWNALAGVALVAASRDLERPELLERARRLESALTERVSEGERWFRSALGARVNRVEVLEDYAAVLLFKSMLIEDEPDDARYRQRLEEIAALSERVTSFREETSGAWRSARSADFPAQPADSFDSPTPSPVALAELALQRSAWLTGNIRAAPALGQEMVADFGNLAAGLAAGEWYTVDHPEVPVWHELPPFTLHCRRGPASWCFRGVCHPGTDL